MHSLKLFAWLCLLRHDWLTAAFTTPLRRFRSQHATPAIARHQTPVVILSAKEDSEDDPKKKAKKGPPRKRSSTDSSKSQAKKKQDNREQKKEAVVKAAAELRKDKKKQPPKGNFLDILDPFKAGKKLRETLDTALTTLGASAGLSSERRAFYYVDDRFLEPGGALFSERNPLFDRMEGDGYVPEVLVVGATGEVGRLVVRRLLLDGRFRVRVLVRDLYSTTLNLLGTGVTYCQGDLGNIESLEYALTDVDKIVFCAGAPRPDETDFLDKFQEYVKENLETDEALTHEKTKSDMAWEKLEFVLEMRAKLAEQVDCIGMQNLVRAYQNVRHADYGTSQAAKRSLFKFQDRPEDFNLFAIDEDNEDEIPTVGASETEGSTSSRSTPSSSAKTAYSSDYGDDEDDESYGDYDDIDDDEDKYADMEDDYGDYEATTTRKGASVKAQCQWIKNKFDHGVFVGKVPKEMGGLGGEAAVISSRLRSREEPEMGIDLSSGFAGLVCRICSDGGTYEAFVRSGAYETDGIEYVCEFSTITKPQQKGNKSRNRFTTVRLPFENFKPVQRRDNSGDEGQVVPPFKGRDVRQLGFRYRSESNKDKSKFEKGELSSFYLALSYIKVYRSQPEPEFVYLSDSRIPPVIRNGMVRHSLRQLITTVDASIEDDAPFSILDEATLKSASGSPMDRSSEETYFKYRGEEILKNSGLSYAIVRVSGYNELQSGETSTIDLKPSNDDVIAVSRAEVAQVCASALLDPNALNKSFYMSKSKRKSKNLSRDEDMSTKFSLLPSDS